MAISDRWRNTRPLTLDTEEAAGCFVEVSSADPRVLIAYLFGSRARGESAPESDIDFAFHADRAFKWGDYYLLWRSVSRALHTDRFDLVWLDMASPDIVFHVIKFGRPLFHRSDECMNDFELYAKKRFWDYKMYLGKKFHAEERGMA